MYHLTWRKSEVLEQLHGEAVFCKVTTACSNPCPWSHLEWFVVNAGCQHQGSSKVSDSFHGFWFCWLFHRYRIFYDANWWHPRQQWTTWASPVPPRSARSFPSALWVTLLSLQLISTKRGSLHWLWKHSRRHALTLALTWGWPSLRRPRGWITFLDRKLEPFCDGCLMCNRICGLILRVTE